MLIRNVSFEKCSVDGNGEGRKEGRIMNGATNYHGPSTGSFPGQYSSYLLEAVLCKSPELFEDDGLQEMAAIRWLISISI